MMRTGLAFIAALALAGCVTPTTSKRVTTLGEVDMTNMICRRETLTGTTLPKTTCAHAEDWAAYDKRQAAASEGLFEYARQLPNVGRYNRGP
jgi:hypothetical protein